MKTIKQVWWNILAVFSMLWVMCSPFIVVVSSILTTIDWYLASHSILEGILGFIIGGGVAGIVVWAVILFLGFLLAWADK
ncbi:MAG: hypothetical protein M0R77_07545 [Gammaproteobacteria bacterium]|nr:hypothetical protein [Gammaproteobacteria bacterium]